MLAEKYRLQGFEISRFGASSQALKRFSRVVYAFNPAFKRARTLSMLSVNVI